MERLEIEYPAMVKNKRVKLIYDAGFGDDIVEHYIVVYVETLKDKPVSCSGVPDVVNYIGNKI